MIQTLILLLLNLGMMGDTPTHPFHVSHTDIRFNDQTDRFEVTSKIFIDDMELAISNWSKQDYTYEETASDSLLNNYFISHFSLNKVKSDKLPLTYLGSELSKDLSSVWIYLESDSIAEKSLNIEVRNSLIMETYDDQKNILSVECLDETFYLLFQVPDQLESITLQFEEN